MNHAPILLGLFLAAAITTAGTPKPVGTGEPVGVLADPKEVSRLLITEPGVEGTRPVLRTTAVERFHRGKRCWRTGSPSPDQAGWKTRGSPE